MVVRKGWKLKNTKLFYVWLKIRGSERIYLFMAKTKTFGRMEEAERRSKSERQTDI
jgi:hypothetical protein